MEGPKSENEKVQIKDEEKTESNPLQIISKLKFDEGILKTKYYADTEQTYTYNYSFDDGELTFNGIKLIKVE